MKAIRWATTIENNSKDQIIARSFELIEQIFKQNNLVESDIISIFITATSDIDECYPSVGIRNFWLANTAMLNFEEKKIVWSLALCIRYLIHIEKNIEVKHVYLHQAQKLRPDWEN